MPMALRLADVHVLGPKFLNLQGFAVIAHLKQLEMRNILSLNAPTYSPFEYHFLFDIPVQSMVF